MPPLVKNFGDLHSPWQGPWEPLIHPLFLFCFANDRGPGRHRHPVCASFPGLPGKIPPCGPLIFNPLNEWKGTVGMETLVDPFLPPTRFRKESGPIPPALSNHRVIHLLERARQPLLILGENLSPGENWSRGFVATKFQPQANFPHPLGRVGKNRGWKPPKGKKGRKSPNGNSFCPPMARLSRENPWAQC